MKLAGQINFQMRLSRALERLTSVFQKEVLTAEPIED